MKISINKAKAAVLFLLLFIIFYIKLSNIRLSKNKNLKEGYSTARPIESYSTCINMGYGRDFCSQTPVYNTNTKQLQYCNCADNRYGTYQFDNICFCILDRPSKQTYVSKLFQNYR